MMERNKILIVDDRDENLHSLEVLLKEIDADIVRAKSGNEALQKMLERDFALILMDVQMPGMDGFETVKIMRQDQNLSSTPVIFLSAIYKEEKYLMEGIASGAVDFIVKPIQSEILLGKVRIFLNLYERKRRLEESNKEYEREVLINKTLSDLAKQLIEPEKTIKEMADSVFSASLLITDSEHGFVSEIDRENGDNIGHTLSAMMGKSCRIEGDDNRIVFSIGDNGHYPNMWGQALNTGQPLLINDYESHHMRKGLPEGHVPMRDFLTVPVKYGEEVIGQIAVTNCRSTYRKFHIADLERVADLYAVAIKRKRDEEDRLKLQEEVKQSEKMQVIGQLAGGMAHNFNNILNGILSAAQLLKNRYGKLDRESGKFTDIIISSSLRAAGITEKLLQYSRKNEVKTEFIETEKIIDDCVAILKSTVDNRISIETDISPEVSSILGDSSSIENVILNLGLNGSQAIDGKGRISYKAYNKELAYGEAVMPENPLKQGHYVCIEVSDTGKGISEENLRNIFKPFYTTRQNGTGLGLSVSHRTISDHSGAIQVVSQIGKGTTFILYLPAFTGQKAIKLSEDSVLEGNGSILFIDDEEINRVTGSELLESLGYSVITAESGSEALRIYASKKNDIDLIITDMQMPEMNGRETIERLRAINDQCKVILISGFSEEINSSEIEKQNITAYLQKPYKLTDLSKVIAEVLQFN